MKYLIIGFVLGVLSPAVQPASLYNGKDSYTNVPIEPQNSIEINNIEDNIIDDRDPVDEEYDIPGLLPPNQSAKDYYKYYVVNPAVPDSETPAPSDSKYEIDTANKVLRLKTDDTTSKETKLSQNEEEEIKKLSAAFLELFQSAQLDAFDWDSQTRTNTPEQEKSSESSESSETSESWKNLNPVITLSNGGISISFVNDSSSDNSTSQERSSESSDATDDLTADDINESLWSFLAKSVDRMLSDELHKRSNATDIDEEIVMTTETDGVTTTTTEKEKAKSEDSDDSSTIGSFVSSLWNVMKTSIEYVESLFNGSGNDSTEATPTEITTTTTEKEVKTTPSTTTTLFAYEEPSSYHRFPSQEFEKRGRDIDSILYGHGIA